jgi:hypothetical protein
MSNIGVTKLPGHQVTGDLVTSHISRAGDLVTP